MHACCVADECEEDEDLEENDLQMINDVFSLQACISHCILSTDIVCRSMSWCGDVTETSCEGGPDCYLYSINRYTDPDKVKHDHHYHCTVGESCITPMNLL